MSNRETVPFPLVVAVAALAEVLLRHRLSDAFRARGHGSSGSDEEEAAVEKGPSSVRPSTGRNLRLLCLFFVLWVVSVVREPGSGHVKELRVRGLRLYNPWYATRSP